jgi:hypothetical protein
MQLSKLTLKELILEEINKEPRGYVNTLAEVAGFTGKSKGTNLTRVLRDPKKEFDNINGLIKIVKHLFGKDEKKLMEQYSKEIDPNNKSARHMLEYLSVNRMLDSMKNLIDKMTECKNKDSRDWARLYSILHEWQSDFYGVNFIDVMDRLNAIKTNIPELNVIINITRCNCFYKNKVYRVSYELSHGIGKSLENIKDEYIKMSYSVRYHEIMSYLSLRVFNDLDKARIHAQSVLDYNVGKSLNAYAYYILGCSYLLTDYDKSREYLVKSAKIYTDLNRKDAADNVKEEIELLDIMWDKDIFSVYYSKEYRYYWYMRNNRTINVELESLNLEEQFYLLIKGMKEDSTDILMQSLILFVKNGDLFLANLPKLELLKRGYNNDVIESLLSIYIS